MATYATRMKYCFGLWWRSFISFINFMLMALVTGLHHGIGRLMLVMAGRALCNSEVCMFLVRKSNITRLGWKLDNCFIFRDCQHFCHGAADKQRKQNYYGNF